MRILIDLLHPAHVHFFRHFRGEMQQRGHEIIMAARDKDVTTELLEALSIPAQVLTKQEPGTLRLAYELLQRVRKLAEIARRERIDVITGVMGPSAVLAARISGLPSVVFYDTEIARVTNRFVYPMATWVCTPDCYTGAVRGRHVTYPGYQELAYLHPDRFSPDPGAVEQAGIDPRSDYFVVRTVSFESSHDAEERSLARSDFMRLLMTLQEHGRVLLSSERQLPPDLEPLRLVAPVADIHHILAYARLVVSESATMSCESVVLGTPAVYVARLSRGYIDDLAHRRLLTHVSPDQPAAAIDAVERWVLDPRDAFRERHEAMIATKCDVTAWQVEFFQERLALPDGS